MTAGQLNRRLADLTMPPVGLSALSYETGGMVNSGERSRFRPVWQAPDGVQLRFALERKDMSRSRSQVVPIWRQR